MFCLGLGTEFQSQKIARNRLGTVPLFCGIKCSFRRIPSSAEEPIPKLGTKRNGIPQKNLVLRNSLNTEQNDH
jgi:hypothetical protein